MRLSTWLNMHILLSSRQWSYCPNTFTPFGAYRRVMPVTQRWGLIKAGFSRRIEKTERIRASRQAKRERGLWQRRYWEHQIRDENDFERHVDYIHYNPVMHGYVSRPIDWPFSTFHGYVQRGRLPANWANGITEVATGGER